MTQQRILVVQTAFIGDMVLTTPLISALRSTYPGATIDLLATPYNRDVLARNPDMDQLLIYDKAQKDRGLAGFWRQAMLLRQQKYQLAFLPHRSLRSALLTRLAGIGHRVGFDWAEGSRLYTQRVTYRHQAHEVERNLDLLRACTGAALKAPTPELRLFIDESEATAAKAQLAAAMARAGATSAAALFPGSVWPTKRWWGFDQLATSLLERGVLPVFMGGPGERELMEQMQLPEHHLDLVGKFPLRALPAQLAAVDLVVTNDNGPLHFASALKKPTVAIFCSTDLSLGFGPYRTNAQVVTAPDLPCRPCSHHGLTQCPKQELLCVQNITVAAVLAAVERVRR